MNYLREILIISLISTFSFNMVFGQVMLKPLYEEFTSATCYPCADANDILDPILEANMDTHTAIKYQMSWPGSGDIYYTDEGNTRKEYYGVEYAPLLNINAVEYDPFLMTQSAYDSYLPLMTPVVIEITSASIDEDYVVSVSVDVSTMDVIPAGLKAHVVIVEKITVGNVAYNGETEFFNVMMKMLPDANGTALTIENGGDSETLSFSYDMSETNMEGPDDLAVVVFVQNDADKSIVQSEYGDVEGEFDTQVVTILVEDALGNTVDGAEVFLQSYGFQETDASGTTVYPEVYNGDFDYLVTYPGLLDAEGNFEVSDGDQSVTIVMQIPDYLVYEDFAVVPPGWSSISSGADYISWFDGVYTILRQSGTLNPLMLITPAFDISNAEQLIFNFVASSGEPEIGFGTLDDPLDPDSYTEIASYFPAGDPIEHQINLPTVSGLSSSERFCWPHKISTFSWVSLDYFILTEAGVSINEIDALRNIEIYPNPSNETVNIHMDEMMEIVTIYNGIGQMMFSELINDFDKNIDVSDLPSGMYNMVIETEKGSVMKSIIVE